MSTNSTTARARLARVAGLAFAASSILGVSATSMASAPTAPVVLIAARPPSLYASRAHRVERSACPSSMAQVGSSCVDKYEGALVEILDDGTEVPFSPYQAPNGHRVKAVSKRGAVPQAHISMVEAKRACQAAGKRLCRAGEWTSACKGPQATRYPYGDERIAGTCVDTNRTSPMTVLYGGERSSRTMNDPRANQMSHTVEPSGSAASCTNGYGVHDMVGNVHEWTDDGSFRGGYYLDTRLNGEGCEYRTTAHASTYYDYSTGFRCCADAGSAPDDES